MTTTSAQGRDNASCASVLGLGDAVRRYGEPALRSVAFDVTSDTLDYWRRVRKKRSGEVIMLVRLRSGGYLVHTKAFYPEGVYRLISGGIKAGENLIEAVLREAHEETSLDVRIERFLAVFDYRFRHRLESESFRSYLFSLEDLGGVLQNSDPSEAITGFRAVSADGLECITEQLESLPPDWIDWGRFRGVAHRFVLETLR